MAVRRQQYAKELEKELAKGKGLKKAMGAAAKKSVVKRVPKKKKSTWVSRLKRNVRVYYKSLKRSERQKKRRRR